ncbi:MAG: lipoyl domain-containing protein [Segetibacter sp.]
MAEEILMPRLSDTMTEGVIAAWHKNVGDTVNKGDLLAEIETDKATMELGKLPGRRIAAQRCSRWSEAAGK